MKFKDLYSSVPPVHSKPFGSGGFHSLLDFNWLEVEIAVRQGEGGGGARGRT